MHVKGKRPLHLIYHIRSTLFGSIDSAYKFLFLKGKGDAAAAVSSRRFGSILIRQFPVSTNLDVCHHGIFPHTREE